MPVTKKRFVNKRLTKRKSNERTFSRTKRNTKQQGGTIKKQPALKKSQTESVKRAAKRAVSKIRSQQKNPKSKAPAPAHSYKGSIRNHWTRSRLEQQPKQNPAPKQEPEPSILTVKGDKSRWNIAPVSNKKSISNKPSSKSKLSKSNWEVTSARL